MINRFVYSGQDRKHIPKDVELIVVDPDVMEIRSATFANMKSLKYVEFPEGLEKIGPMAFAQCFQLKYIKFPSTLIEIGSGAFYKCHSLTAVKFPTSSVLKIGKAAFLQCFALKIVEIPDSAQYVGEDAFSGCPLSEYDYDERFHGLHAHRLCYDYDCCNDQPMVFHKLHTLWNSYPKSFSQIDALGMTATHIFAASPNVDTDILIYLAQKCPESLVQKDDFGMVPRDYAVLAGCTDLLALEILDPKAALKMLKRKKEKSKKKSKKAQKSKGDKLNTSDRYEDTEAESISEYSRGESLNFGKSPGFGGRASGRSREDEAIREKTDDPIFNHEYIHPKPESHASGDQNVAFQGDFEKPSAFLKFLWKSRHIVVYENGEIYSFKNKKDSADKSLGKPLNSVKYVRRNKSDPSGMSLVLSCSDRSNDMILRGESKDAVLGLLSQGNEVIGNSNRLYPC